VHCVCNIGCGRNLAAVAFVNDYNGKEVIEFNHALLHNLTEPSVSHMSNVYSSKLTNVVFF
jgi:hypothetical protein